MKEYVGFDQNVLDFNKKYEISRRDLNVGVYEDVRILPGKATTGGYLSDIAGGVFDASGVFIESSSQPRFDGQTAILDRQPPIRPAACETTLEEAVWGGVILDHFGHFLLESTCRLWSAGRFADKTWVFIAAPGTVVKNYQYTYLELLGLRPDNIRIVTSPVEVRTIHIPEPSMRYHSWVNHNFISAFRSAKVDATFADGKYFLSRAHLDSAVTVGELELIEELEKCGWRSIRLENFNPAEQVALFRSESQIMGVQGSAFHNALFSAPGRQLIQICRSNAQRSYFMLDELSEANALYIYGVENHELAPFGASGPFLIDPGKIIAMLKEHGVLDRTVEGYRPTAEVRERREQRYQAWWYHQAYLEAIYPAAEKRGIDKTGFGIDELLARAGSLGEDNATIRRSILSRKIGNAGHQGARLAVVKALLDFPNDPLILYFMSCSELEHGFIEEARLLAQRAITLAPKDVFLRNHYIALLYRVEAFAEAIEQAKFCYEKKIADAMTDYIYSLNLNKMNDRSAIDYALKASFSMPDNSVVQRNVLNVMLDLGDFERMEGVFSQKEAVLADDGIANYMMSIGFQRLNRADEMMHHARRAHALEPDNETIRTHLDLLVRP